VNWSHYFGTRQGALNENRISRMIIAGLVGLACVQGVALLNKDTTVIMVPPTLEKESAVGASEASPETQVAWGMYLTGLLGNVTPKSAPALRGMVQRHLSPNLYDTVSEAIGKQAKEIQDEQVSLSFNPSTARYDAVSQYVGVTGELTIRGLQGQEKREVRSYELGFKTQNYNVLLNHLRIMQGGYAAEKKKAEE